MRCLVVVALLLCYLAPYSGGADILAAFPFPGKSHWIVFRELLLELSQRGHRLTVVSYFSEEHPPSNWEQITLETNEKFKSEVPNFFEFGDAGPFVEIMVLSAISKGLCTGMMDTEGVRKLVTSSDRKFDLLLTEVFFNDCYLAFAHKYKIPIVAGCAVGGGISWMNDLVGNPFPHAYLPEPTLTATTGMSFFERAYNSFYGNVARLYRHYSYIPQLNSIVQKHFQDPSMPSLADLAYNTSLILVNTHVSFYYPRPLVPNMIEVGGMHIKPPKKLPQRLQTFMDEAGHGIIFFSLGSNIKSSDIPEEKKAAIISVFSKLKQRILWKFDLEYFPNQPDNLMISKWLPQNDILNHKSTRVFITHGGLMSIQEAICAGVPLLGIPVFGDQKANLARAEADGIAIKLTVADLTEESFERALSDLLDNPRYKESAERRSALFHDRPERPLDSAVRWTEYVLRHRGAPHLRSAALDLPWFQLLLLDVLGAAVALLAAALSLAALAARALLAAARTRAPEGLKED